MIDIMITVCGLHLDRVVFKKEMFYEIRFNYLG